MLDELSTWGPAFSAGLASLLASWGLSYARREYDRRRDAQQAAAAFEVQLHTTLSAPQVVWP